ncbi:metalloendopeptidase [Saccharothrix sp. ALI-22-I]|uniref:M23 family metallopeptidase n=1 Tax=Saccharothrix sp. ALI-22-I TaxID=1933778 RepID=UPI00097BD6D6|nr:metalloendopeptidase [Saccharothrix sp. ALI-22-I]
MSRRVFVMALMAPLIGLVLTQGEASAAPNFQMPFPCNQVWEGQTRTGHSPPNSVDFNRANDDGDPVVASAAGTVTRVANEGSTSYGRWVEIDHGSGWRTRYAHLSAQSVSVGQAVRIGQRIGSVGTTGGSTGPHLHYEQRLNGADQKITFNGSLIFYWGTRSYTSRNSCSTTVAGTVGTDSGAAVTIRSGPGTSYSAVGSVASGATVTISCQAKGETITGKYGTTNLWDKIGSGYISDAFVYTGSDGQVAPDC